MNTAADLKACLEFRDFLRVELDANCISGKPNESRRIRFVRLAALLQNMNAGQNGGGLSGALACEKLWVELLKDINLKHPRFSFDPTEADADYAFSNKAFSHKTIGLRNKCAEAKIPISHGDHLFQTSEPEGSHRVLAISENWVVHYTFRFDPENGQEIQD